MLTCQEVTELVTAHMEGRLSFLERLRFHMHVGMCRHCRAYFRQMRETVKQLGALPPDPVPDDVYQELRVRLKQWKSASTAPED